MKLRDLVEDLQGVTADIDLGSKLSSNYTRKIDGIEVFIGFVLLSEEAKFYSIMVHVKDDGLKDLKDLMSFIASSIKDFVSKNPGASIGIQVDLEKNTKIGLVSRVYKHLEEDLPDYSVKQFKSAHRFSNKAVLVNNEMADRVYEYFNQALSQDLSQMLSNS